MSYSSDRQQPGAASCGPPLWNWFARGGFAGGEPGPFLRGVGESRPLRIALVVLAFIWWWPIGLATLFVMMWSKRMGCWNDGPRGFRQAGGSPQGQPGWGQRAPPGSGNRAFDEYRTETLRRLEDEQRDFVGFLDRLRYAKDKAEFDQFLAERRQMSDPAEHPDPPPMP